MALLLLIFHTSCMTDLELEPTPTASSETTALANSSAGCASCDFYVSGFITDGKELGVKPGDVICLKGGNYDRLIFRNIVGTQSNPVIIRNCTGTAKIYSKTGFGVKFEHSKEFKFVGDGNGPGKYGIKISAEAGFYLTMEKFTTDFEIAQIEIAGPTPHGLGAKAGFAGIGVKTSPYQDCNTFRDPTKKAWAMKDVKIHHNYIHDTGGEGLYIGHGFYKGRQEQGCSFVTYAHSIKNIEVYENRIENVGYDGIQIKNADQHVKVYNNIVRNYGTKNHGAHNEGLFIGEGTVGKFFGNIIDKGTGHGCSIQGMGNLDIFNNVFANSGENGIYATHGSQVVRRGYFNIFNNTIYKSGEIGFVFHNNDGGPKRFINNLVIKAKTLHANSAQVEMRNNIFSNDVTASPISGLVSKSAKLLFGSTGVDQGADLTSYGVVDDNTGGRRFRGKAFDIGAYEIK